jgi:ATP-binding cassette subfamily F protein 3
MKTKDIIKDALRDFDGTLILVSHDRDFLDGLATKVLNSETKGSWSILKISLDSWQTRNMSEIEK